jgi:hypothetical protein
MHNTDDNNRESCADLLKAQFRDPEEAVERIAYCADVIEALVKGQRPDTRHAV